MKLILARRDTFLYKQSGVVTNCKWMFYWKFIASYIIVSEIELEERTKVTRKTTKKRTEPIELPSVGMNRTSTFDSVSPTTTLYEIIAEGKQRQKDDTKLMVHVRQSLALLFQHMVELND